MIDLAQKLAAWLTSRRRVPDTERCTCRTHMISPGSAQSPACCPHGNDYGRQRRAAVGGRAHMQVARRSRQISDESRSTTRIAPNSACSAGPLAAGVDAPVGCYSGGYFRNYSRASPCRCHPSVPPRRTATSRKPAASSSVAARADRRSVLQTSTTGSRRAASSPARPDRSASGTLTAPGRWPGGAVNSSG
jgi:hypothetical protein